MGKAQLAQKSRVRVPSLLEYRPADTPSLCCGSGIRRDCGFAGLVQHDLQHGEFVQVGIKQGLDNGLISRHKFSLSKRGLDEGIDFNRKGRLKETLFRRPLSYLIQLRYGNRQRTDGRQHRAGIFLLFAERGHIGRGQFRRRQSDGSRVDRLAVDACFIMQVRAGRTAGCTDKTNHFAGTDSAVGRTERAHVAVQGFHTVGMANHHGVTVAAFPTL